VHEPLQTRGVERLGQERRSAQERRKIRRACPARGDDERYVAFGQGDRRGEDAHAVKLQVKYARIADTVNTLSGGNQQKVVLAKWLATGPRVLIVDEPTRGIDVGTKAEVHRLLSELAADGVAVLMISSDLPEILGMADRVLVMHEGRLTAEIPRAEATEETVMAAATGRAAA